MTSSLWYIENDPALHSTVVAIVWERAPDQDVLVAKLGRTTRAIPSFRQRVVQAPLRLAMPRWTVDETFDLTSTSIGSTRQRRATGAVEPGGHAPVPRSKRPVKEAHAWSA